MKNKIIFFGTPRFSLPTLTALRQSGYNIVSVITRPDQPTGRNLILTPSPVKILAAKFDYKIIDDLKQLKADLPELKPDLGIIVAYGKIIPEDILEKFPLGCLNLHPSLLPRYRGPSPIQAAILNGDQETGLTIIKIDKAMDHGPIVAQETFKIDINDTGENLENKLSETGANLLIKILPDYLSGKIIPRSQNHQQATFTKIINKEAGQIDWSKSAKEINQQIKAFYPWPGSYTEIKLKDKLVKIKILSAQVAEDFIPGSTGLFQQKNGQLYARCSQGNLEIFILQPAGKKEMSGQEFINGYFK